MTSFHTAFASGALIINYMNNFTLCTFTPVKMTEYMEQMGKFRFSRNR